MVPFNVLFIDSFDSFTYNVVRLIEKQRVRGDDPVHVTTIHNDTFTRIEDLQAELMYFDCIIVGPGPGNPANGANDVGIISSLFCNELANIPLLGICLGFQALCFSQGASVGPLDTIKHGQVCPIELVPDGAVDLFNKYPPTFKSVRYHSLHVLDEVSSVIPLAHTHDENGQLLMAAKVKDRPWYGVQYHPESCCSELGDLLVKNFLSLACEHNNKTSRFQCKKDFYTSNLSKFNEILKRLDNTIDKSCLYEKFARKPQEDLYVRKYNVTKTPELTLKICDSIDLPKFIMASSTINASRGEWSIVSFPDNRSDVLTHYSQLNKTTIHKWQDPDLTTEILNSRLHENNKEISSESLSSLKILDEDKSHFWITMADYMKTKLVSNNPEVPFIGGLVGVLGYEMGYHVYNDLDKEKQIIPDAKLVYVENNIVIDHRNGILYCISLSGEFPKEVTLLLENCEWLNDPNACRNISWSKELPEDISYEISMPDKEKYAQAFNRCQTYMHKGDSYEMCLTTQTEVIPEKYLSPWRIFQTLVQRNPAPFSSFFEFSDIIDGEDNGNTLCLLSTSPERFLKWDQDTCELRPIKGTVKKSPEMSLEKATEILKTPKEFGENLMILDLIRNDLFELIPDVNVESFMSVEEYKTVYQLVSVVKAYGLSSANVPYSGIDVLKHSLPPGSMTGAPKKSTTELLQNEIEADLNKHVTSGVRGIYSGVTGYWSANGNGDWSVNIRCMYSYNGGSTWHLGAGGAITVLSTLEGELEEMYTKLESALQVFT